MKFIPADLGYSGYYSAYENDLFASLVQWLSNGDLWDPAIRDEINNIIRATIISIDSPLCVSPCSLILDSTPSVSGEQEDNKYSAFRSSSQSEPRDHDTLAVRDLNDPLNQVASQDCSSSSSQSSTVPGVTFENHGDVSSNVLGKRKFQNEDSAQDSGGRNERRRLIDVELKTSKRRTECNNCGETFARGCDKKRHDVSACKNKPLGVERKTFGCPECGKQLSR